MVGRPKSEINQVQWGVREALGLGFFGFIFMQLVGGILLAVVLDLLNVPESIFDNVVFNFATYAAISLVATAPIWWYLRQRKLGLASLGFDRQLWTKKLWRVLPAFGIYYIASIAIYAIVDQVAPGIDLEQAQELGFEATHQIVQLGLIFVSLVIIPPLVEETIFRGFLFQGLRRELEFWPAAVISALCFGVAHWQTNIALDTAALGIVSCWLFERTNSIWPSIGLHALKNLVAFALVFIIGV